MTENISIWRGTMKYNIFDETFFSFSFGDNTVDLTASTVMCYVYEYFEGMHFFE